MTQSRQDRGAEPIQGRQVAHYVGFAACLLGCLVLAGWVLDIARLRTVLVGANSMKPLTALGFIFVGLSLIAATQTTRWSRLAVGLAALPVAIGAVTLVEYVSGRSLGIDRLWFEDSVSPSYPGRMSPTSAINFVLLGFGILLFLREKSHPHVVIALSTLAFGSSLFALIGYAYGVPELTGISPNTIAIHTAAGFLVVSLGLPLLLDAGKRRTLRLFRGPGSLILLRLLPATTAIAILLGWLRIVAEREGLFRTEVGVGLLVLSMVLSFGFVCILVARRLNAADSHRNRAEEEIRRLNRDLQQRVEFKTAELRAFSLAEDPRVATCEAALRLSRAKFVRLFEPTSGRRLESTAQTGIDLPPTETSLDGEPTGVSLAFVSKRRLLVTDVEANLLVDRGLVEATGARSLLYEPVLRADGSAAGVLVVGWAEKVEGTDSHEVAIVGLLASDVAIVLDGHDLLVQLEKLARTDALTGLANRRVFDEELERELARARRSGAPLCLAILDLDHFKEFNDKEGHQMGDMLLKEASAAWETALRETDFIARYGGEEFLILLPGSALPEATAVIERLRSIDTRGQTFSAGLACWDGLESEASLIARADRALYRAKDGGRDQVVAA